MDNKMWASFHHLLLLWCFAIAAASANLASQLKGRVYLNNYITAIEDDSTDPTGLMVTTADSNYAISSPRFERVDWLSVTVNEGLVFIVTNSNSTLVRRLHEMNAEERDLIAEVRANFLQNLTGLKLSRAVASDSLLLLSNKFAYASKAYASSDKANNFKLSQAEQAIHLIESVNQLTESEESAQQDEKQVELAVKQAGSEEKARSLKGVSSQMRSRSGKAQRDGARKLVQKARSYASDYAQPNSYEPTGEGSYQSSGLGFCSRKSYSQLSYFNLLGKSSNQSLSGDIYNFDLRCNILDVYSSSVSIRQTPGLSVLYRDENYFAYSRSDLPQNINRFFLQNDKVFFVYHDRSLLLKHDWLLTPLELEVVIGTRRQLRSTLAWNNPNETHKSDTHREEREQDEEKREASEQVTGNEQESVESGQRALAKERK